jgi:hypothetical protein
MQVILRQRLPLAGLPSIGPYGFASGNDAHGQAGDAIRSGSIAVERNQLPWKVELWDKAKQSVDQVLALAACGGIGSAAHHAARHDFRDRYIALRHNNRIVSQWTPPAL